MRYLVIPCQCDWPSCKMWQVRGLAPEAKLDRKQAEAVADLLNQMDAPLTGQTSFTIHLKEKES